jgi:hypothetical protein
MIIEMFLVILAATSVPSVTPLLRYTIILSINIL